MPGVLIINFDKISTSYINRFFARSIITRKTLPSLCSSITGYSGLTQSDIYSEKIPLDFTLCLNIPGSVLTGGYHNL